MAINTSEAAIGLEDVIANNIPSRAFRYTAENKNVLSKQGAIYVGTGRTHETKMLLDYETYDETKSYAVGDHVEYNGLDYECKQTSQGNTPRGGDDDNYWKIDTIIYTSAATAALNPPSEDGTYILKCTVSGGVATLEWVAENQNS